MARTRLTRLLPLHLPALLVGCPGASDEEAPATSSPPASSDPAPSPESSDETDEENDNVAGTMVSFQAADTEDKVTITEDIPAANDFLSMLQLTLEFEEYAGNEKISYLPRELDHEAALDDFEQLETGQVTVDIEQ